MCNGRRLLTTFWLAIVLTACGGSGEEPEGAIPQHQLDAMEKAKNVEGMLREAEGQRREEIDGQ